MDHCVLSILFTLAFHTSTASSALWYTDSPIIDGVATVAGVFQKAAVITYKTNFTINDTRSVKSIFVELPPDTSHIATGGANYFQDLQRRPFFSRLNASFANNLYTLQIKNLGYSDEYTFRGVLLYVFDNDIANVKTVQQDVKLDVYGGPNVCGTPLSRNTTLNASTSATVSVQLCGRQKPLMVWKIDDVEITTTYSNATAIQHKYTYSVKLSVISSMCGKTLSYLATGYQADINDSTQLNVQFEPPPLVIQQSYKEEFCIYTNWNPINTGLCPVEYEVNIMNISGSSVHSNIILVNSTVTQYSHCFASSDELTNITYLQFRGVYGKSVGPWSQQNISLTTPKPITTVTSGSTPSVTSGAINDDDDDDDILPIAIGAGCGGALLLVIFIVLMCYCCSCCCWGKRKSKKDSETRHGLSYSDAKHNSSHTGVPVYNGDVEMGKTNEYQTMTPAEVEKHTEEKEKKEKLEIENNNTEIKKDHEDDDDDGLEVVSVAQLKYFDPDEFNIKKTPTIPHPIKPEEAADKAASRYVGLKDNETYDDDEFDSDHSYENYEPDAVPEKKDQLI